MVFKSEKIKKVIGNPDHFPSHFLLSMWNLVITELAVRYCCKQYSPVGPKCPSQAPTCPDCSPPWAWATSSPCMSRWPLNSSPRSPSTSLFPYNPSIFQNNLQNHTPKPNTSSYQIELKALKHCVSMASGDTSSCPMASSDDPGSNTCSRYRVNTTGATDDDGAARDRQGCIHVQSLTPVKQMSQHVCTFALYSHDMSRQIETHHYITRGPGSTRTFSSALFMILRSAKPGSLVSFFP